MNLLRKSYITITLMIMNVAIFLLVTLLEYFAGIPSINRSFAMFTPAVLGGHEFYRLFTSMFLHSGMEHLGANMLALLALGPYVERIFGRLRFSIIYFVAGICGGLLTIIVECFTGHFAYCIGASGAIFGLFGAVAFLALLPQFRRLFPFRNVILSLVVSLGPGFTDPTISLTGHLGGLIGGFVAAAIIYLISKRSNQR